MSLFIPIGHNRKLMLNYEYGNGKKQKIHVNLSSNGIKYGKELQLNWMFRFNKVSLVNRILLLLCFEKLCIWIRPTQTHHVYGIRHVLSASHTRALAPALITSVHNAKSSSYRGPSVIRATRHTILCTQCMRLFAASYAVISRDWSMTSRIYLSE